MERQAEEIEASLKLIAPSGVSAETRNAQLDEARAFAEKASTLAMSHTIPCIEYSFVQLKAVGKEKASDEIFDFVNQMEMHLKLDDLAAGKELHKTVDAVMAKLDTQLEMIGKVS